MASASSFSLVELLKSYIELSKVRITIAVTLTCGIGFVLATGSLNLEAFYAILGTFIIACGSAALNQYQEYEFDIKMGRTENRPIPAKKISPFHGLMFSLILAIVGFMILLEFGSENQAVLGLSALFVYNVLYTPMKRKTTLAVFPGAIIGAIPPLIGWVAGGADLEDIRIWSLAFFIFIWQIPHFWLLVLIYDEDYKKAGYPTLTEMMSKDQLSRVTYMWIFGLAISCLLFPLFRLTSNIVTNGLFIIYGAKLMWDTKTLLKGNLEKKSIRKIFMKVNIYVLIVLFTLIFDRLIN